MTINKSVTSLKGVGNKRAELLEKLEIQQIFDLIKYYPRQQGYIFLEKMNNFNDLKLGEKNICHPEVVRIQNQKSRRGLNYSTVVVKDADKYAEILLFGSQVYQAKKLKSGMKVLLIAIANSKNGKIIFTDAVIKESVDTELSLGIMPTYRLVQGLTQTYMQQTVKNALEKYLPNISESLPDEVRQEFNLIEITLALQNIHLPKTRALLENARKRLVFEELFYIQFSLWHQQRQLLSKSSRSFKGLAYAEQLICSLPFTLTVDQLNVWGEIKNSLSKDICMQRLLQGDVGSGKTVIAAMCAATACEAGFQTAVLAPTEILARQHYEYFAQLLAPFGLNVELLVGNMGVRERRALLSDLQSSGRINVLVGTHALLQHDVQFANLGMVVVDEQHRFGVQQRQTLIDKAKYTPHLLAMSATPIPRTLALALYGTLDISTIKSMPAERKLIKTLLYTEEMRDKVYQGAQRQVAAGHQVYIVCPLIDESEDNDSASAENVYQELVARYFSAQYCVLLHGRMPSWQKEQIMQDFVAGSTKVLVSTTVIEVGINVPNATLMIIENAERFGLAQLHQLRGRVGRGSHQSYCALLTTANNPESMQRLGLVVKYSDGFVLAEYDLQMRGVGEMLGKQQHGLSDLNLADIIRDSDTLLRISSYIKKLDKQEELYQSIVDMQEFSIANKNFIGSLN